MKMHSMEIRRCVLRAISDGELTQEEIAEQFGVSSRFVRRLWKRWRGTGSLAPLPHGGGFRPKITPEVERQLIDYAQQHPDATLAEIRVGCRLSVSLPSICDALKRLGLQRKKKIAVAAERERPDVQAKRLTWKHKTYQIDANRFIFVDQTSVSTKMQRDFGRAHSGVRVFGIVPQSALPYIHTDGGVGIGWQVRNFHLRRWNRRCQDGDFYREHSGTRIEAKRYRGLGQLEAS